MKNSTLCRKTTAVEGVGPLTATAIVGAIGDAKQFSNGRHLAANTLIHGARTVLQYAFGKADKRSRWLQQLIVRRGYNCAAVALANKNARILQVLLSTNALYKREAV